jgi:hypothetical protein
MQKRKGEEMNGQRWKVEKRVIKKGTKRQEKTENQRRGERAMEWERGEEPSLERQERGNERKTTPKRVKKERRRE